DINRLSVVRKRIIHLIAASSERISLAGRTGTGAGRFEELDRIRHHFGHLDPPTFAVFKAPDLKPSIHSDQTSLFQVVGAGLGLLPPGDDVDGIGFPFPMLIGEPPIDRQRKGGDGYTVRSVTEFGILGETTDQNHPIDHEKTSPFWVSLSATIPFTAHRC